MGRPHIIPHQVWYQVTLPLYSGSISYFLQFIESLSSFELHCQSAAVNKSRAGFMIQIKYCAGSLTQINIDTEAYKV